MYLLELVGDDDAFARREAAARVSDVRALAPGLAIARGVRRPETLAYTRRVGRLVGTTTGETTGTGGTDYEKFLGNLTDETADHRV